MTQQKRRLGIFVEWGLWMALGLIAYNITHVFDKPIESYRYGATGWPRFILLSIMAGATLQFIFQLVVNKTSADDDGEAGAFTALWPPNLRMLAVFFMPLLYLWLVPRTGFYLTTPIFIVAYMVVLGVRSWKPLVFVTGLVCSLILLIFTRFFYVALPVGNWQPFYDINNAIIVAVRAGL